uniref:Uncharacterized protein n=1 Tax=Tanacetum cinerariifolium TaxID=118510 RepID=A0A699JY98_TANCI|nr:hypothetical protein [Tanacetum cinerariifolium]
MIPTSWSPVIIVYDRDVALGISHWGLQRQQFYRAKINMMSKHKVFITMRILSVVSVQLEKKSSYGYLKKIVGIIFKNMVEDVQQGVESYQRKLNLTKPQRTYKSKKKRLLRVDEIHKFCDGTLQSVRNILHERLLNFKFGYNKRMPFEGVENKG